MTMQDLKPLSQDAALLDMEAPDGRVFHTQPIIEAYNAVEKQEGGRVGGEVEPVVVVPPAVVPPAVVPPAVVVPLAVVTTVPVVVVAGLPVLPPAAVVPAEAMKGQVPGQPRAVQNEVQYVL